MLGHEPSHLSAVSLSCLFARGRPDTPWLPSSSFHSLSVEPFFNPVRGVKCYFGFCKSSVFFFRAPVTRSTPNIPLANLDFLSRPDDPEPSSVRVDWVRHVPLPSSECVYFFFSVGCGPVSGMASRLPFYLLLPAPPGKSHLAATGFVAPPLVYCCFAVSCSLVIRLCSWRALLVISLPFSVGYARRSGLSPPPRKILFFR